MRFKHLLAVLSLIISVCSFAQSTFEEGGLLYMEDISDPSKMAVIVMPKQNSATGDSMYSGDVIVPASIEHDLDTYEVVGLSTSCFFNCPDLTSLEIRASLKKLPEPCIFSERVKKIILPDTLEEIPGNSIYAPNVEEIYLGKNLKTLGIEVGDVTELSIPYTIESINGLYGGKLKNLELKGDNLSTLKNVFLFSSVPTLESVSIKGKNLIIDQCFTEAENLTTLHLSGIKSIKNSFNKTNIDKLVIPEGVIEIDNSFERFNGTELTLPNSLTNLNKVFRFYPNLKIVRLGKGINSFNKYSFLHENQTIYCPWDEVPDPPHYFRKGVTFVVPKGMEAKYREAWADKLKDTETNITFREEDF